MLTRLPLWLIISYLALACHGANATDFPLIRGMANADVKQLQQQLITRQLLTGKADGTFGANTVKAVKTFQQQHQLPVTGQVDEATWRLLTAPPSPAVTQPTEIPPPNPATTTPPTVQVNALDNPPPLQAQDLTAPSLQPVKIAVLADRGVDWANQHWGPTAEYLTQHIPGYQFSIEPLPHEELNQVAAVGSVEFILTNPAMYVKFESLYKIRPIATLKTLRLGKSSMEFGSVLFCNSNRRDITQLADLKHKRVAAVEANAFGGWLMVKRLFIEADIAIDSLDMSYLGTHDNVVLAVRDGLADAGVVRTDTLERMAKTDQIKLTDFTLVHRNTEYGNRFPFLLSTHLYPEWPFAATAQTPGELLEKVAITLMSIPKTDPVAKAGEYEGWTVPLNYQPVHDILKILQVEPYQDYGKVTLAGALRQYWPVLVLAALVILILTMATLYSRRLNGKLTRLNTALTDTQRQLEGELLERQRAENRLQQASENLKVKNGELEYSLQQVKDMQNQVTKQEKMASLGRLTAGIATEMKIPLKLIASVAEATASNLQTLQDKLEEQQKELNDSIRSFFQGKLQELMQATKKIHDNSERIEAIMRNMLAYTNNESPAPPTITQQLKAAQTAATIDINQLLDKQASFTYQGMKAKDSSYGNIVFEKQWADSLPPLAINDKELAKALVNLVNNACYAVHEKDKQARTEGVEFTPTIKLSTTLETNHLILSIWDNGTGIASDIRDKVWQPLFTTKPRGMGAGLGLPMSRDIIVKTLKGSLTLHSEPGQHTEAVIRLPLS